MIVGYAFLKGSDALRDVVKEAFAAIMKNGEYGKVLEKWGLGDGALKQPFINQGPNAAAILGKQ